MKLVIEERESDALRDLLRREPHQLASALVEVELVRAVRRAVPGLVPQAQRVVSHVTVIELMEPIRARAALLDPVTLRSLDVLHLATVLEMGDDLDGVVTYDSRMAAAAKALDLKVLAPA